MARKLIVTGCARSGTTLMHALLGSFPDIKIFQYRETFHRKLDQRDTASMRKDFVAIKRPQLPRSDERWFGLAELLAAEYTILNMVRDPRDVLVSHHPDDPQRYWVEPERWIDSVQDTLDHAPAARLSVIRYEALVAEPDQSLQEIARFLKIRPPRNFADFYQSGDVARYLGGASMQGAGPVSTGSVGAWRQTKHKGRIGQVHASHGPRLEDLMQRLGYEWTA